MIVAKRSGGFCFWLLLNSRRVDRSVLIPLLSSFTTCSRIENLTRHARNRKLHSFEVVLAISPRTLLMIQSQLSSTSHGVSSHHIIAVSTRVSQLVIPYRLPKDNATQTWKCPHCSKSFNRPDLYKRHLKIHPQSQTGSGDRNRASQDRESGSQERQLYDSGSGSGSRSGLRASVPLPINPNAEKNIGMGMGMRNGDYRRSRTSGTPSTARNTDGDGGEDEERVSPSGYRTRKRVENSGRDGDGDDDEDVEDGGVDTDERDIGRPAAKRSRRDGGRRESSLDNVDDGHTGYPGGHGHAHDSTYDSHHYSGTREVHAPDRDRTSIDPGLSPYIMYRDTELMLGDVAGSASTSSLTSMSILPPLQLQGIESLTTLANSAAAQAHTLTPSLSSRTPNPFTSLSYDSSRNDGFAPSSFKVPNTTFANGLGKDHNEGRFSMRDRQTQPSQIAPEDRDIFRAHAGQHSALLVERHGQGLDQVSPPPPASRTNQGLEAIYAQPGMDGLQMDSKSLTRL